MMVCLDLLEDFWSKLNILAEALPTIDIQNLSSKLVKTKWNLITWKSCASYAIRFRVAAPPTPLPTTFTGFVGGSPAG